MVFGTGMIANRFIDYSLNSQYFICAGNINDSSFCNNDAIQEEELTIKKALSENRDITFVYFSSCSILDSTMVSTPYVKHKIRMEKLVQNSANKFLIFRLPQVMGLSDAESSLVNYLVDAISNYRPFELWENAHKNLIDIDDVHEIVGEFLGKKPDLNKTVNIASTHQTSVAHLVNDIETFLGVAANYELISNQGTIYDIDLSEIQPVLDDLDIDFGEDYIKTSLEKYFGHLGHSPKLISIIIPTYNNEHGIEEFYHRTKNVLRNLSPRFNHEMIFVNDSSTDDTYSKLEEIAQDDHSVKLINFSKNFGNQIGITAGIDFSQGDIAIVIDDDLQDPPEIILNLISKWDKGYKVVYGVRPKRQGVNPIFKVIAKLYYRIISILSDTKIPIDTGDFRLIDRMVIETLKEIKEENRYYRGLVAWVGYSQIGVVYERDKRYAGSSTFSLMKYVNFAFNGLTSFTEKPLYFSSFFGLFITSISFIFALILVINKIIDPSISIPGWTSLTVITLFFGGIQLLSIGIIGVYISKIYREVKARPLYIVESTKNTESRNNDN